LPPALSYVPAGQREHTSASAPALYEPGRHASHVSPTVPSEHGRQTATELAPNVTDRVLAGQMTHASFEEAFVTSEYVPAGHSEHADSDTEPIVGL